MARNTTLAIATKMLKVLIGSSITSGVATAADEHFYTLIDMKQTWLAQEYDWPFLKQRSDVALVIGTRYYTLPTLTTFNYDRPIGVSTLFSTHWRGVDFGIGQAEYNALSSGDGGVPVVTQTPQRKWDWKPGDEAQIEVWPVPSATSTLRFEGQRTLKTLLNAGAYDTTKVLDLDDELIVLYVAAELLAREKQEDSKLKLALAEQRLNRLRAVQPVRADPIILGGAMIKPNRRVVPITTVA